MNSTHNSTFFKRYALLFSVLCAFIIPNYTPINALNKPEQELTEYEQQIHTMQQELLEGYFQHVLTQLKQVDSVLEGLAFTYAQDISAPAKSRNHAIAIISEMRELVSNLRDTRVVLLNEQLISSYIYITHAIINQLIYDVQHKLNSFSSLDVHKLQLPTHEITIEMLNKEIVANDQLLAKLNKLSNNIGLHWYNKVYRKLRHAIVDPAKAAAVPALCIASLSTAAFFIWFYSNSENPKWLRDKVGWPALFASTAVLNDHSKNNPLIQQLAAQSFEKAKEALIAQGHSKEEIEANHAQLLKALYPHGTRWLGNLEARLVGVQNGQYPMGTKMIALGASISSIILPPALRWAGRKIKAADSFLMGGAYKYRNGDDYVYSIDVTFDNIIGQEDAKQYGRELCQYLKNPELFDRAKIAPSTGILLFGDTRTGKSFYISALYGEIQKALGNDAAQFKIWPVNFNYLLQPGGIEKIMEIARRDAPMILVIEEIDLLGLQRVNNAERLANFMTSMSSCLQENRLDKTVIIIGTTNKLENLEPALRETGRFGKHIYFSYPKFEERRLYIEHELQKSACNLRNFDIDKLARDTEGCSFEKLGLFIKRAFLRAKLYNKVVTQESLEESIDENIRGISRNKVTLNAEQKQLIASHLAGHIVANLVLDPHQKVSKVTLHDVASKIEEELAVMQLWSKDGKTKQAAVEHGKIFAHNDHDFPEIETREEKIKQCKVVLAGYVAEKILLGSCGYGYHAHDKQIALNIAKAIVSANIDLAGLPRKIRDRYFDEAFALLTTCEQEITQLLEEHRSELEAVVNELIEKETLELYDLRRIVLGEECAAEQLDAGSLLTDLLKGQCEECFEEPACARQHTSTAAA
jgi:ATP-dependent Zn protease